MAGVVFYSPYKPGRLSSTSSTHSYAGDAETGMGMDADIGLDSLLRWCLFGLFRYIRAYPCNSVYLV